MNYHLGMFDGHNKHCGSRDKMFLVTEEQNSICLLNSAITIFP